MNLLKRRHRLFLPRRGKLYLESTEADPGRYDSRVDKVTYYPLEGGDAGTRQTISHMVRLIREGSADPVVKDFAINATAGIPFKDRKNVFYGLLNRVRSTFRYVNDSDGLEQIWTPRVHADRVNRHGFTAADCDDLAVWIGALARSLGFRTRLVTLANGRRGKAFNHVLAEVEVSPGEWISTDFLAPNTPRLRSETTVVD